MHDVTFVGNLLFEPEFQVGQTGKPRLTFSVAVNEGERGTQDEKMHPIRVTAWGTLAENAAQTLTKGMRVIVKGRFNTYDKDITKPDGTPGKIQMLSFRAIAIGPDLQWATAQVAKVVKPAAQQQQVAAPAQQVAQAAPQQAVQQPVAQAAPVQQQYAQPVAAAVGDDF